MFPILFYLKSITIRKSELPIIILVSIANLVIYRKLRRASGVTISLFTSRWTVLPLVSSSLTVSL